MSEDEADYMSDKFLGDSEKQDIRPGLLKRKQDRRELTVYKKKIQNKQPKRIIKEAELRETGLNTAISEENKGFKMLAKMGYKPGTSLGKSSEGLLEPINISLRKGLSGIGAVKKTSLHKTNPEKNIQIEKEFRKNVTAKRKEYELRKYFYKAQTACEFLDGSSHVKEPIEDFYWPKEIVKKLREVKTEEDADSDVEEDGENEVDDYDLVITEDNLNIIIEYIRSKYFYCIYCAAKATDEDDLKSFCPGPDSDDHETD